jgi:hypothetical protein
MTEEGYRWCGKKVRELLAGRRGHGGGPCTKRVLSAGQLDCLLRIAYQAGVDEERKKNESKS